MFDEITLTKKGLYCKAGNFYIDPWAPVETAVVTHAHADHLTRGCKRYFVSSSCKPLARHRLDSPAEVNAEHFGEHFQLGDTTISFHPAGHVLGSAQVRVEVNGVVWVISGDYKLEADETCESFEQQECDVFVSEATFGLPIYKWKSPEETKAEINNWWKQNSLQGRTSLLCGYSLGKAQRLLSLLETDIGEIYTHPAVEGLTKIYRDSGISLPETTTVHEETNISKGSLVIAPPASHGARWTRGMVTGYASGWMSVRGARARRAVDRGFVLSDHADWPGLLKTIKATKATKVLVTHGSTHQLGRYLKEQGMDAEPLETRFGEEE